MLAEIKKVTAKVETIGETNDAFAEFYAFLRGESTFAALGKGENFVDVLRYFYRETVKKYKLKYGMEALQEKFSQGELPVVLDVRRPNLCADFTEILDGPEN